MTMYQPKQKENYWKVAQLITNQRVTLPVEESTCGFESQSNGTDRSLGGAIAVDNEDFERAISDLTGCSGVF